MMQIKRETVMCLKDIALSLAKAIQKRYSKYHPFNPSSIIRVDGRGSSWTKRSETRHGKGLK